MTKPQGMTKFLNNSVCFYIVLFLAFWGEFITLKATLGGETHSIIYIFRTALADTTLIVLFCLLLRGKWTYLVLIPLFLIPILSFANMVYFRFFEDMIPASLYGVGGILNQATFEATLSALRPTDFIIFIFPILFSIYIAFIPNGLLKAIKPNKYIYFADSLLLLISWGLIIISLYRHQSIKETPYSFRAGVRSHFFTNEIPAYNTFEEFNFTGYLLRCLIDLSSHNFTTDSIIDLPQYFNKKSTSRTSFSADTREEPRNLIFIVAESLPYVVLEKNYTPEVTPTLYKIIQDSNVNFFACFAQVTAGVSSDAQFIYNTGLLPLKSQSVALSYPENDYPSIAKALNYKSTEIIGEPKQIWNHDKTTKSYGYNRLIDDVASFGVMNADSLIFLEAARQIEKSQQPFFFFISTMSMHGPYTEERVSPKIDTKELASSPFEQEYLQRLNHFDRQLETFLGFLKDNDIYDNSVIIIIGDHPIIDSYVPAALRDNRVPLIILNSQLGKASKSEIYQIDVFPTILDIFGVKYTYQGCNYGGQGTSVFSDKVTSISDEDYRVSSIMIKRPS